MGIWTQFLKGRQTHLAPALWPSLVPLLLAWSVARKPIACPWEEARYSQGLSLDSLELLHWPTLGVANLGIFFFFSWEKTTLYYWSQVLFNFLWRKFTRLKILRVQPHWGITVTVYKLLSRWNERPLWVEATARGPPPMLFPGVASLHWDWALSNLGALWPVSS